MGFQAGTYRDLAEIADILFASRFRKAPVYQSRLAAVAYQSPFSGDANSNMNMIVPVCSASSRSIHVGQILAKWDSGKVSFRTGLIKT